MSETKNQNKSKKIITIIVILVLLAGAVTGCVFYFIKLNEKPVEKIMFIEDEVNSKSKLPYELLSKYNSFTQSELNAYGFSMEQNGVIGYDGVGFTMYFTGYPKMSDTNNRCLTTMRVLAGDYNLLGVKIGMTKTEMNEKLNELDGYTVKTDNSEEKVLTKSDVTLKYVLLNGKVEQFEVSMKVEK